MKAEWLGCSKMRPIVMVFIHLIWIRFINLYRAMFILKFEPFFRLKKSFLELLIFKLTGLFSHVLLGTGYATVTGTR